MILQYKTAHLVHKLLFDLVVDGLATPHLDKLLRHPILVILKISILYSPVGTVLLEVLVRIDAELK